MCFDPALFAQKLLKISLKIYFKAKSCLPETVKSLLRHKEAKKCVEKKRANRVSSVCVLTFFALFLRTTSEIFSSCLKCLQGIP